MSFTLEELCAEANRRSADMALQPADGRTNPQVTARNVRYYQTLGLLPPVSRADGRAVYGTEHLEAVLAVKAAQARGVALKDLPRWTPPAPKEALLARTNRAARVFDVANRPVTITAHQMAEPAFRPLQSITRLLFSEQAESVESALDARVQSNDAEPPDSLPEGDAPAVEHGWFVDLGDGMRLSGTGDVPSDAVLLSLRRLLAGGE